MKQGSNPISDRFRKSGKFLLLALAMVLFAAEAWAQVSGYAFRKRLEVNNTQVSGSSDLSNFPILVDFTDADLRTTANGGDVENANGYDIVFTDSDGSTQLNHQLESYNASTGRVIAWVQIPTLQAAADTPFYIYYGNPSIGSDQSSSATWDSNYQMVHHYQNDVSDATSFGNNGTDNGTTSIAGRIGNGRLFDSTDFISVADDPSLDITGQITISAWVNATNAGSGPDLITKGLWDESYSTWIRNNQRLAFGTNGNRLNGVNTLANNTWYYLVFTKNAGGRTIYINGSLDNSDANTTPFNNNNNPLTISSGGFSFNGMMDEVRISNTARSTDWVATEYNNQNNPGAFIFEVPEPSVLANIESTPQTFNAGGSPVNLTSSITASDPFYTDLQGATVQITGNYNSGEDQLNFTDTGSITGSWDSGSGTLTLSGAAGISAYETALRNVTYENTNGSSPDQSTRTVSFTVNNGVYNSNTVTREVNILVDIADPSTDIANVVFHFDGQDIDGDLATNDQPADGSQVGTWGDRSDDATGGSSTDLSFTQGTSSLQPIFDSAFFGERGALRYDGSDEFTGPNDNSLNTNTFSQKSFAAAFRTGTDVSGLQVVYEQGGGLRGYQISIKDGIAYAYAWNHAEWPVGEQDKSINLGAVQPNESYIVVASHDATSGSLSGRTWTATLNGGSQQQLSSIDVQESHGGGPVIGGEDGTLDPVTFLAPVGATNFSGDIAELLSWNTALNGGQMADVFTYLDDKWSNTPPQLSNIEISDLDYTEGDPATSITSTLTVNDSDNTVIDSAYVTISSNYVASEDQLDFTPVGAITGSFDSGTGRLILIGQDSKANYETVLRSVTYENTNGTNPSTALRQVDFEVFDWDDVSNTASRNINVISINTSPSLSGIEGTDLSYTEGDGQVSVTSSITLSDLDDTNMESATIQITGNYIQGEDFLDFTDANGITGSFNGTTGTLTLTGTATEAEYITALQSVTYENNSPDPVTLDRTVSFTVNDGDSNSNTQGRNITITSVNSAPVLAEIESSTLGYSAGDPPTEITDSLTADDFDNTTLQSATVQITGNYDSSEDVLAFNSIFGISGSWDQPSGTLTLTGSTSPADYEAALRTVTYENTSGNPSIPTRTVSFTVSDGTDNSNTVTRDISVSVPGSISGLELWLRGDAGISASDGNPVNTWADQSGNGRDFTGVAGSGSVPTFISSEPQLNNMPAVDFLGNGGFMEDDDGFNYINGLTEFTLFVVKKSDQTNTDRGFWHTKVPDNADDVFTYRYDANGANAGAVNLIKVGILNNDPNNQLESFSDIQTTNGQITMLQWESGNVFDLFVDGVLNNPSGASTPPTGTISNATTAIVGKGGKDEPNTPGQSWDGRIAEVILYGRDLSQSERMSIEDYLSEKYDIPIRLLTPATGGEAISADDANTTFTSLTGPIIREEVVGKLEGGETIVLKTPAGYEWDTGGSSPTATVSPAFGGTTNLQVSFTGRTSSEITFTVDQASSSPNRPGKVTFGGLRVRPTTGVLPNSGNITNVGTTGQGGTTNYGTLTMVPGVKDSLAFSQQPTNNNVNENISPAVRVQLVDQYGNIVEEGGVSVDMALSSGTGTLSGTTTQSTNALGIAEFADLQVDQTGTKKLTASSTGLASVESNNFDIVIAGQFTTFRVERAPSGNITPKTAGQEFNIKISAVDGTGNVDTDFNGTVVITSNGTIETGGGTTASFTNGVLSSHTVSITSVGDVTITATNSSGSESGDSNEFPVSPGSPSGATSQITANPEVILNDGASTSTITVQLKDAYGNNLASGGATVALSTDNGSLGSVTDNGDGTYTATLTSSTSEVTATISGTFNGNNISDNAQVQFAQFNAVWQSQLGDTDIASDWNLGSNWSSGTVPGSGDIILVPADPAVGNEYPVIDVAGQAVGEVSIETSADITVSGGINFTVEGNLTGGGNVNGANNDSLTVGGDISLPSLPIGTVVLNGASKQTVTNPHTYTNLTVDNSGSGVDVSDNLFINGTLSLTNGTLTIPSGKNLIANTKNIGSGQLAFERIVSGNKGWRMISTPVASTYEDLLDSTVTQGYPGAFYDASVAPNDTLQPTVLWYDETQPGTDLQRWRAPGDATDALTAGRGLYVYFFGDVAADSRYNNPLPDTLLVNGLEHEGDGTEFDFNVTYTATADTGWNFIGNPFGATLDWDAAGWTKTGIDNTIYVWDPEANGGNGEYLTWNGTTGTLGSGRIAPFQGFWVKANGPAPVLKVNKSNKTTGGDFKRKEAEKQREALPIARFELSYENLSASTSLSFQNGAKSGKDINDGYRLLPFTDTFMEVFTTLKSGAQMAVNNLPKDFDQRVLIPLHVGGYIEQQPISGVVKLTWPGFRNIPNDWLLTLVDNKTGDEINMLSQEFYVFEMAAEGKSRYKSNNAGGQFQLKETSDEPGRFTVRISTDEIEARIPQQAYLNQNYPNPFNPTTTIVFGLSEDTDVTLNVYDILGRRVKTLISDRLGAGVYDVNFDARGLASGVYIYRLTAGDRSYVKKFTFIK